MGFVKTSELQELLENCSFEIIPSTIVSITISFVGSKTLRTTCNIFIFERKPIKAWKYLANRSGITFQTNEKNRLEISWDENILMTKSKKLRVKRSGSSKNHSIVTRAKYISGSDNKDQDVIIAVSFLLRTDMVIDMCAILSKGFDHSKGLVIFSLRHKNLTILTSQIICAVIGEVQLKNDLSISMKVIHPTLGEVPMKIKICSEEDLCISRLGEMLEGTIFCGCSLRRGSRIKRAILEMKYNS